MLAASSLDSLRLAAIGAKNKYNITTDVPNSDNNIMPGSFELFQNFPNPFNPSTIIRFTLKKHHNVNLSIYNILGKKVINLVEEKLPAGMHSIEWNGVDFNNSPVSSGIYFYRLSVGDNSMTRKMTLLK